ncbi:unnamed protein product [Mytilus edulis]|uniref:B box-type domain-containing protein n=1 Tax=Mytilus edulis TaxID=6550 RepID=A0A8S3QQK4_MYTED|nr:unnamed protein product [Mytilus edulis]
MAASERLCDICETRDITVFATDWCPECEQGLCESCKSHHSAIKSSKNHQTISLESFNKLPTAVQEIKNDCSEHGARFEYYCSQHEVPCCVECIKTTHAECRHLTPMHKVVEHNKTSNALTDFDQTLSDFLNNLNTLIQDRLKNISVLADQKKECLKGIKDAKKNVIAHLNTLEMKLKSEIETLHREHLKAIQGTIKEFEELKTNAAKVQEEVDAIKQYGSDFQRFIAFRDLETKAKVLETGKQSLATKDSAKQISLSFSTDVVQSVEKLYPTLGNVIVNTKESDIKLVDHRGKQAQILAIAMPCIDKIQLKPVFENVQLPTGKNNGCVIWGNCFLSKGRLAFSDSCNKRLIVFKDNGDYEKDITLPFHPDTVAFITDNEIAVGNSNGNTISIINSVTSLVDNSFEIEGNYVRSFSFRKGQFLIVVIDVGFILTDIEGNVLKRIPSCAVDIMYAVLLNDKIYFSQLKKHCVFCCDLKGKVTNEYRGDRLKNPVGLTCSDTGVFFITGFSSHNILTLSITGNEMKELFSSSKLNRARAISYNSSKQQLLVSTEYGNISLFDVSY